MQSFPPADKQIELETSNMQSCALTGRWYEAPRASEAGAAGRGGARLGGRNKLNSKFRVPVLVPLPSIHFIAVTSRRLRPPRTPLTFVNTTTITYSGLACLCSILGKQACQN